jgi:hypothetical protein
MFKERFNLNLQWLTVLPNLFSLGANTILACNGIIQGFYFLINRDPVFTGTYSLTYAVP